MALVRMIQIVVLVSAAKRVPRLLVAQLVNDLVVAEVVLWPALVATLALVVTVLCVKVLKAVASAKLKTQPFVVLVLVPVTIVSNAPA